jgi:hypothetical protein
MHAIEEGTTDHIGGCLGEGTNAIRTLAGKNSILLFPFRNSAFFAVKLEGGGQLPRVAYECVRAPLAPIVRHRGTGRKKNVKITIHEKGSSAGSAYTVFVVAPSYSKDLQGTVGIHTTV